MFLLVLRVIPSAFASPPPVVTSAVTLPCTAPPAVRTPLAAAASPGASGMLPAAPPFPVLTLPAPDFPSVRYGGDPPVPGAVGAKIVCVRCVTLNGCASVLNVHSSRSTVELRDSRRKRAQRQECIGACEGAVRHAQNARARAPIREQEVQVFQSFGQEEALLLPILRLRKMKIAKTLPHCSIDERETTACRKSTQQRTRRLCY